MRQFCCDALLHWSLQNLPMETGRTEAPVTCVFSYICYILSAKCFILLANGLRFRLELVITEGRALGFGGAGKV